MDDYMFRAHVKSCRNVVEKTSYLEILNYSVSHGAAVPKTGMFFPFLFSWLTGV